jgi:Uma2 family endonuclease
MSSAASRTRITPKEYLALERRAPFRSEYHDGSMYAMAGASREHSLIASNLCREIGNRLVDRPCEVYVSDMRLLISATGLYTYPDVVVACGEVEFEDSEVDTLLNPVLIVEVLSPSTERYDRGKKFGHYRRLGSLREYVLVSQDRPIIELFTRDRDDERWILSVFDGSEAVLELASVDCRIPLAEVYRKVAIPNEDAASMEEPSR